MPYLELANVTSGYGRVPVLRGVSLTVEPGELVTLLGPNGSGKTTALKSVLGLVRLWGGSIRLKGHDLEREPTHVRPRLGVGYVPQGRVVFPRMTVAENLLVGAFSVRRERAALRQRIEEMYELFPRLQQRRRQMAGSLSGGEQQMLAIARALMCRPELLLLDEPSVGLAPALIDALFDTLVRLRSEKLAMLMVEQNAVRALEISDRGYVLALGRIQGEGSANTLLADPLLNKSYLGAARIDYA